MMQETQAPQVITQSPQAVDKLGYSTPVLRDHGLVSDLTKTNYQSAPGGSDLMFGAFNYQS